MCYSVTRRDDQTLEDSSERPDRGQTVQDSDDGSNGISHGLGS